MSDPLERHPQLSVVRRLAVGGMGEVLLTRFVGNAHVTAGLVVVKRTIPDHPQRAHQDDLLREEGRIALRLRHANLVDTYALDELEGHPLLIMEYLAGRSMAQVLGAAKRKQQTVPVPVVLKVLHGAACGLHFAHTLREGGTPLGLVHRDVSPANIFATFDGKVKVIDFGVAKADDSEIKTSTGILKGKLGYMSPEHARGEKLDPRADLWSLGVVFWEMLVADRLFGGQNPALTLVQITQGQLESPRLRRPDVPPVVEALCMRLLTRDREQRIQSCAALVHEIEKLPPELWRDADIGGFVAERFPAEADVGRREMVEAARRVHARPVPSGLVDGGAEDSGEVATVLIDSAMLAAARAASQSPFASPTAAPSPPSGYPPARSPTPSPFAAQAPASPFGPSPFAASPTAPPASPFAAPPPTPAPPAGLTTGQPTGQPTGLSTGLTTGVTTVPTVPATPLPTPLRTPTGVPSAGSLPGTPSAAIPAGAPYPPPIGADPFAPPPAPSTVPPGGPPPSPFAAPPPSSASVPPTPAATPTPEPQPQALVPPPATPAPSAPPSESGRMAPAPAGPTQAEATSEPPRVATDPPRPADPAAFPFPSRAEPRQTPARPAPSALAVALSTFGALAFVIGLAFALLADQRETLPVFVGYAAPDGADAVVARLADVPEGVGQPFQLALDSPRLVLAPGGPREAVAPLALARELKRSGVWQQALLPATPKQRVALALPAAITLLGLLSLAFSLPALLLPAGSRQLAIRAGGALITLALGAFLFRAGGLGWPGQAALAEPDVPPRLTLAVPAPLGDRKLSAQDETALQQALATARAALLRGQPQAALSALAPVAELLPDLPAIHAALGDAQRDLGRGSLAEGHYLRYLELFPEAPDREEIAAYLKEVQGAAE